MVQPLSRGEIEVLVQSFKKTNILDIGSVLWFEQRQSLEKLRQQCLFEAANYVHERVKDIFIEHEKMSDLIFDVICLQIWREKVLDKVFQITDGEMKHSFIGYLILYNECTTLNFLVILLHHRDAVQSIIEESVDLIDYCAIEVVRLCSKKSENEIANAEEDNELMRLVQSEREMSLNRGLSSIAILASFSEYIDELSVTCIDRLYNTHDFPIIMVHLLEIKPWQRINPKMKRVEVYNEGQWTQWSMEEICKYEAQCWFVLRGLLLHEAAKQHYNLSEFRKQRLLEVQKYLHEHVVDQLSPLMELRQFLSHLTVMNTPKLTKTPLLLESVAEIRCNLLSYGSKWKKLRERNIHMLLNGDRNEVMEIAKRMSETYDGAILAQETKEKEKNEKCQLCGKIAFKKCSQCHCTWYCSRECQVTAWKTHKKVCEQIKQQ